MLIFTSKKKDQIGRGPGGRGPIQKFQLKKVTTNAFPNFFDFGSILQNCKAFIISYVIYMSPFFLLNMF